MCDIYVRLSCVKENVRKAEKRQQLVLRLFLEHS